MHPVCEVLLGVRLHAEERAAYVNHFPRQEEGRPGKTDEGGSAGTEDIDAAVGVSIVVVFAKITCAEAEEDENKGAEAEGGHPKAVDKQVNHDFEGEDPTFELRIT